MNPACTCFGNGALMHSCPKCNPAPPLPAPEATGAGDTPETEAAHLAARLRKNYCDIPEDAEAAIATFLRHRHAEAERQRNGLRAGLEALRAAVADELVIEERASGAGSGCLAILEYLEAQMEEGAHLRYFATHHVPRLRAALALAAAILNHQPPPEGRQL